MFNKVSTKRKIVAGLGLLGSVGAVGMTQISSDMSKWPNFGANVGLSIGVSVFVWFLTDNLRERLFSKIADLQSAVGSELAQLKSDLETSKDWTETQQNQLKKVLDIVNTHSSVLTAIDDEISEILDGVLTALDVKLEDNEHQERGSSQFRPASARWQVSGASQSVKGLIQGERRQTNEAMSKARRTSKILTLRIFKVLEELEIILSKEGSHDLEKNEATKGHAQLRDQLNALKKMIEDINKNASVDQSSAPGNPQ